MRAKIVVPRPLTRVLCCFMPLDSSAAWSGRALCTVTPMGAHEELVDQIKQKAVVHGRVTLSSGREADYYVDLRRITLDAVASPLVGEVMLDLTEGLQFDAAGGLTLGADPIAGGRAAARR